MREKRFCVMVKSYLHFNFKCILYTFINFKCISLSFAFQKSNKKVNTMHINHTSSPSLFTSPLLKWHVVKSHHSKWQLIWRMMWLMIWRLMWLACRARIRNTNTLAITLGLGFANSKLTNFRRVVIKWLRLAKSLFTSLTN